MPARNIVVICSGPHEKKVNLGEVFPRFLAATSLHGEVVRDVHVEYI